MLLFSLIIVGLYSCLLLTYWWWWTQIQHFSEDERLLKSPFVSVIIPARNEEKNIGILLNSIAVQNYPLDRFEVLVIDDFSEDNTTSVVNEFKQKMANLHLIKLADVLVEKSINSYKKKSIEIGVMRARGEFIITTDADCIVPPEWIKTFMIYYDRMKPSMVIAPVKMVGKETESISGKILNALQILDFMTLQGITGAALSRKFHFMGNGANLSYRRDIFIKLNGFAGVDKMASGDDMFLIEKVSKHREFGIAYIKDSKAMVITETESTWSSFFRQRIRWAGKSKAYSDWKIITVLVLVYLVNVWSLVLLVSSLYKNIWGTFIIYETIKVGLEGFFLVFVSRFFNEVKMMKWFLPIKPLHCLYIIVSGFFSLFVKYQWKGRTVT